MKKIYLAIILMGIFGASFGIWVNLIGNSIPVESIAFIRVVFSFITIGVFVRFVSKNPLKISKKDFLSYALIGILLGLAILIYTYAFFYIEVASVSFFDFTYVPFVFIIAYLFLRERPTKIELAALGVAFVGIALMNPLNANISTGAFLAIAQALLYAIVIIIMRYKERKHSLEVAFWVMLFASLFLLPFSLKAGVGDISVSIHWLIILGIISGFDYLLVTYVLHYMKADLSSLIRLMVEPLAALFFGFVVLSQLPSWNIVVGGGIILLAGALLHYHPHKRKHLQYKK